MTELHTLSAVEMLAGYKAGTLSPVAVTEAVLAQIARCEPELHATYALDAATAMTMAAASAQRWKAGTPLYHGGVTLDGVPTTIKENIATKGIPIPLGTAATDLVPAREDAPAAAGLRAAGAVFVSKTTMPEYGMLSSGMSSFHPLTRNPWNTTRNPGGSSCGAGAAAAAGYGPLHIGTDIGGSVRLPASWCGVFALKPSLGRIPTDSPYMGRAIGPMTRTVSDAALMMGVLSQFDERDHMNLPAAHIDWMNLSRDLKGLRIGLHLDANCGIALDPEVKAAVEAAAKCFEAAGCIVEPVAPWMTEEMLSGMDNFWRTRSGMDVRALTPEKRAKMLPFIREWAESGLGRSGEEVFDAYTQTVKIRAATVAATRPYDYVLSPVAPVASYPADWPCPTNDVDTALAHISFTVPYNMSEQPAASVNCGFTEDGMPIGLQIAGHRFDDLGVLQIARAYETMRPAQKPFPY